MPLVQKQSKKAVGGVTTDLSDSDIRLGQIVDLVYDGTNMQIQSTLGNTPTSGANASGYYVVNQVANAPANAINLGALTTGLLKGTVSAGISTLSTAVAGTDYQAPISNYSTISGLTGYPASFTPSTHASTHASAGGDPVTLADKPLTPIGPGISPILKNKIGEIYRFGLTWPGLIQSGKKSTHSLEISKKREKATLKRRKNLFSKNNSKSVVLSFKSIAKWRREAK
jgi:hypothetical protein